MEFVAKIARDALPSDASEKDRDSAEIVTETCDLTSAQQVRKVFEKYGKGGVWGVIHIAVRRSFCYPSEGSVCLCLISLGVQSCWRVDGNPVDILCKQCFCYCQLTTNHVRVRMYSDGVFFKCNRVRNSPHHPNPRNNSPRST